MDWPVSYAVDWWSLGAVLYECAFGMPSGKSSGPVLSRWKTTAVTIVADIESGVRRPFTVAVVPFFISKRIP